MPKPIDRAMDDACFWELIEETKKNSSSTAEQMELLLAELEAFKPMAIKKFYRILRGKIEELYHWDVWAVAYLAQSKPLPKNSRYPVC